MAKILLVDDSQVTTGELKIVLEEGGFQVDVAHNGNQGIESYTKNMPYDLILADVNMPIKSGIEMCEDLKKAYTNLPPIWMMTTETDPKLKERAKKAGVVGWVLKPFTAQVLLEMTTEFIQSMKSE